MTQTAFEAVPARAKSPLLLLCDHASNALPPGFGTLGLDAGLLRVLCCWQGREATRHPYPLPNPRWLSSV